MTLDSSSTTNDFLSMGHFIHFVVDSLQRHAAKPVIRPLEGSGSSYEWGQILIKYQDFLDALQTTTSHRVSTLASLGVKKVT